MSRPWIVSLLSLLLVPWPVRAVDDNSWMADFFHTHHARKLLLQDEVTAGANVGIRVRDRVAYLWGPVPSQEVLVRAEQRLRECIEFREVRNDLFVEDSRPLPSFLPEPSNVVPPAPRVPPKLAPPTDNQLTRRPIELPMATLARLEEPVIDLPTLKLPTFQEPTPVVVAAPVPTPNLEQQIGTLLRAQNRYQSIRYRVDGPQVFLNAGNANAQALHEAAQIVSRVPGVKQVILQNPR